MWIIACIITIAVIVILLFLMSKPSKSVNLTEEKKNYAMPKQRRYPWFYIKDCHFYADGSSRFAYSESEIEYLFNTQEEAIKKGDFSKVIKMSDEIIRVFPKSEKAWINKVNAIFHEIIQYERSWDEMLSRKIVNACFGFLQCSETILDKSLTAKHTLVPTLLKNVDELIKYQRNKVSKYHNFEVYNMAINIYYVLPFREIIEMISSYLLEDKFDKEFDKDEYAQRAIKSFMNHVDMLRTQNASRLQETIDVRKVTNCTLINDERMEANIIAFDLNFEPGIDRQKIEARFFDENDNEINFGKKPNECFVDIFESKTTRGVTVKEEIVILSDQKIYKVKVKAYKEEDKDKYSAIGNSKSTEKFEDKKNEAKLEKGASNFANTTANNQVQNQIKIESKNSNIENEKDESKEISSEVVEEKKEERKILVYPSFDEIRDVQISNSQFVCLKKDGLVLSIGEGDYLQQLSTWTDIKKVYVKNNVAYAIKEDGTVIYAGNCEYDNPEYIYAWENIAGLYLGDKHMLALTNNATVKAIGNNHNGQCNVDEWYDIVQIAVAFHSVGLTKDGRVHAVGENNFGECDVVAWQDIVEIAAGNFYTIGLTSEGKVLATGLNSCGQCNVSEWTNIKHIYACGNMTVGLRYDGRVVSAGKTSYRVDDVKKWNRIKNIVVSENRIVAIEQDGVVYVTGKPYREFMSGEWQNISNVVMSNDYIVGLTNEGKLISNGLLFGHILSNDFNSILYVCENVEANKIAMLNNQNVLSITNKDKVNSPEELCPNIYDVKLADISSTQLIALHESGMVSYIKFGENIVMDIPEWDSMLDVKAGKNFMIGLNINGTVLAQGDNTHGQCNVTNWNDIVKIDAAGDRCIGQTIDGKLLIAGKNEFGESDFLKTLENVKSFVVSDLQTMVLQNDGTVKLSYNPIGVGAESIQNWKDIKKIVVRENNFLALKEDGTILSTLENEAEISKWKDVEDLQASGSYTWAILK